MSRKVSAIILAAGKSSRMGSLKQLTKIGDRSLLETTIAAVQESKISETILVLGFEAEKIRHSIPIPESVKVVVNNDFEKGMSSSIRTGIEATSPESSAALIVLADQPFLKASVINSLMEEYESSGSRILLPVYKGFRGNPVLIDRSLFTDMMQITGDVGCRSLFGLHADQIRKVSVKDIGVLIDIDSEEDLERFNQQREIPDTLQTLEVADRFMDTRRHLLIVGNDEVAMALAKLGHLLEFYVTVVDPILTKEQFQQADSILNDLDLSKANMDATTSIVVASRGKFDEEALQQAVSMPAGYIALVGSKKRGSEIIQRLRTNQVPDSDLQRIYCPAGLEIHANTPEEIALSVMAQIIQVQNSNR